MTADTRGTALTLVVIGAALPPFRWLAWLGVLTLAIGVLEVLSVAWPYVLGAGALVAVAWLFWPPGR